MDDDHEGKGHYIHLALSTLASPGAGVEGTGSAIQQALTELSGEHRSIVILRDIEGFSYTEIADVLGISSGTVKSRLARARADMKKSLVRHLSVQRYGLMKVQSNISCEAALELMSPFIDSMVSVEEADSLRSHLSDCTHAGGNCSRLSRFAT